MFINEIIVKDLGFVAANSKNIVNNHNHIYYYCCKEEPIKTHTYTIEQEYPYEDEYGKYRESTGGGRQTERGRVGINKKPHLWIKKGKGYIRKIYDYQDNLQRPYTSNWSISYNKSSYPTEKPYKLLSRIIKLSTK